MAGESHGKWWMVLGKMVVLGGCFACLIWKNRANFTNRNGDLPVVPHKAVAEVSKIGNL